MLATLNLAVLYRYKGTLGGSHHETVLREMELELVAVAIFWLELAELQLLLFARARVP